MAMNSAVDLRPEDMALLSKHGIENEWSYAWCNDNENLPALSKLTELPVSEVQCLWHISRLSFLKGYLLAKRENAESSQQKILVRAHCLNPTCGYTDELCAFTYLRAGFNGINESSPEDTGGLVCPRCESPAQEDDT